MVAFWISSPTFLGDKPKGPILGANAEADPISPPVVRKITRNRSEIGSSMNDGHEVKSFVSIFYLYASRTPRKGKGYEVEVKKMKQ
jgi:hypothetical protein